VPRKVVLCLLLSFFLVGSYAALLQGPSCLQLADLFFFSHKTLTGQLPLSNFRGCVHIPIILSPSFRCDLWILFGSPLRDFVLRLLYRSLSFIHCQDRVLVGISSWSPVTPPEHIFHRLLGTGRICSCAMQKTLFSDSPPILSAVLVPFCPCCHVSRMVSLAFPPRSQTRPPYQGCLILQVPMGIEFYLIPCLFFAIVAGPYPLKIRCLFPCCR